MFSIGNIMFPTLISLEIETLASISFIASLTYSDILSKLCLSKVFGALASRERRS